MNLQKYVYEVISAIVGMVVFYLVYNIWKLDLFTTIDSSSVATELSLSSIIMLVLVVIIVCYAIVSDAVADKA